MESEQYLLIVATAEYEQHIESPKTHLIANSLSISVNIVQASVTLV